MDVNTQSTCTFHSTLKLNCPFDPFFGLGNTSAQGYAFWANYYNRYIVTYAKVKVHFTNATGIPLIVGVVPQLGATPATLSVTGAHNSNFNIPGIKYKRINTVGSAGASKTCYATWSISKDIGVGNRAGTWEQSGYSSDTGNDPTILRYLTIFLANQNDAAFGGNTANAVSYNYEITYYTKFYDRKFSAQVAL